jgi:hypothetical protein
MKKILILVLSVILLFSCQRKESPVREEETRPLQLTDAEAELWKQFILVYYRKSGAYRTDRVALVADEIIIELRKRRAEQK